MRLHVADDESDVWRRNIQITNLLWVEAITEAAHRFKILRILGITLKIFPQPNHEVIKSSGVGAFIVAPTFFEELFASDGFTLVGDEES